MKFTRGSIVASAFAGAMGGFAYAAVESSVLIWLPWLTEPALSYRPVNVEFSLALAALYAVGGALLAVLVTVLAARAAGRLGLRTLRRREALAGATVALGYLGAVWAGNDASRPSDAVGLVLAAGTLALAAASLAGWGLRAKLFHPAAVSAVILLPTALVSRTFAAGSLLERGAAAGGAVLAGLLAARGLARRTPEQAPSPGRSAAVWALAAVLCAAAGTLAHPDPFGQPAVHSGSPATETPLILIVLDTVGARHLSLYGYNRPTAPALSRFAEDAILFEHAYSSGSMSLSSHASLFTGLDPNEHGAHNGEDGGEPTPLSDDFTTLAETFLDAGYRTSAISANYGFFQPYFGLLQGFERVEAFSAEPPLAPAPVYTVREAVRNAIRPFVPVRLSDQVTRDAADINRAALREIDRLSASDAPFFLFLNYMDAHQPYLPPQPFDALFPGKAPHFDLERYLALENRVLLDDEEITQEERDHVISQYDGAIAYLDRKLGELFDELRRRNLYDRSVIIVISDHGEAFGTRRLLFHGVSVSQNNIAVPLLIKPVRGPDGYQPRRALQAVSTADVFATALDAVGLAASEEEAAVSQLRPDADPNRIVVSRSYPMTDAEHRYKLRPSSAAMSGHYKLVKIEGEPPHLYDLAVDPDESRDLYRPDDPQAQRLIRRLETAAAPARKPDGRARMPAEAAERLRSLGYLN